MSEQQFFPASSRPELLVNLRLPQGSSFAATEAVVKRFEKALEREAGIVNYASFVGSGSPRFYLPLDQQPPNENFAQFVILTQGFNAREALRARLIRLFDEDFHGLRGNVARLENGPPVGYPVQFRVSGEDIPTVRRHAERVAEVMRQNPNLSNVQFDWDEKSKVIKVDSDQGLVREPRLESTFPRREHAHWAVARDKRLGLWGQQKTHVHVVKDAGDSFFEDEQKLANIRSGPYQSLLNKVAKQLQ